MNYRRPCVINQLSCQRVDWEGWVFMRRGLQWSGWVTSISSIVLLLNFEISGSQSLPLHFSRTIIYQWGSVLIPATKPCWAAQNKSSKQVLPQQNIAEHRPLSEGPTLIAALDSQSRESWEVDTISDSQHIPPPREASPARNCHLKLCHEFFKRPYHGVVQLVILGAWRSWWN